MEATTYLFFCYVLFPSKLSSADTGVCVIRTPSGSSQNVCCADYEEKQSECKPCEIGFTSSIGTVCRPCPLNTFGFVCASDCKCNEFQRCDNVEGCVDSPIITLPVEVDQTSYYVQSHDFTTNTLEITNKNEMITANDAYDFQTTLWLYKTTIMESVKSPGFSTREIVVYYTMSVAFLLLLLLLVCLCVVIRKHKKKHKRHTIIYSRQESTNQIVINNDSPGIDDLNLYEDIEDAEISEIEVKPELISNDYLEVITESVSSKSSGSYKLQRSSYLNPYQPCVSTDDTKSSYEKLQLHTIGVDCTADKIGFDVKNTEGCENLAMTEQDKINTVATLRPETVQNYKVEGNTEMTEKNINVKSSYRLCSASRLDLKRDTFSDSNVSKKYKTF